MFPTRQSLGLAIAAIVALSGCGKEKPQGAMIGKILIIEAEYARRITVILIPETLGF